MGVSLSEDLSEPDEEYPEGEVGNPFVEYLFEGDCTYPWLKLGPSLDRKVGL